MNTKITDELLAKLRQDRELIADELPEMGVRDARMQEAAAERNVMWLPAPGGACKPSPAT